MATPQDASQATTRGEAVNDFVRSPQVLHGRLARSPHKLQTCFEAANLLCKGSVHHRRWVLHSLDSCAL